MKCYLAESHLFQCLSGPSAVPQRRKVAFSIPCHIIKRQICAHCKTCMLFQIYFIPDTGLTSLDGVNPHGYIIHKWASLSLKLTPHFCPQPTLCASFMILLLEAIPEVKCIGSIQQHISSQSCVTPQSASLFSSWGKNKRQLPQLLSNTFLFPALQAPIPKCPPLFPACSPISA